MSESPAGPDQAASATTLASSPATRKPPATVTTRHCGLQASDRNRRNRSVQGRLPAAPAATRGAAEPARVAGAVAAARSLSASVRASGIPFGAPDQGASLAISSATEITDAGPSPARRASTPAVIAYLRWPVPGG